VRTERLSFFVASVQSFPGGWRLEGEPGYDRRHWARPGDRFDRACSESGDDEQEVELLVIDLDESSVTVTGFGGDLLTPNDIISGERPLT
jgi:hypothetical protein